MKLQIWTVFLAILALLLLASTAPERLCTTAAGICF